MLKDSRLLRVFNVVLQRLLTDILTAELAVHDLSKAQYDALRYVAHTDVHASRCDISSLASALGTSVPAATKMADRLQAAGWLERQDAPHDRRHTLLKLTAQGEAVIDQLAGCTERALQKFLEQLPTAERVQLVSGVSSFLKHALQQPNLQNICLYCGETHASECPLAVD
ncbi:MAG: MarR family transcriptional regulator [Firmicutes bacterium]|nr:MarR family transcriptional regulator [Bacillota bacterium]